MALFGGTIESPRELYLHKLGAALTMERKIRDDMLPQLEDHAQSPELRAALEQHRGQTDLHVRNLEEAFGLLGADVDDSSCPAIEGIEKEGQANLKMVDDSLNDAVILMGVQSTEHHEIATYEGLITEATAMGQQQVASLLQQNLEQEQQTLRSAQQLARQVAQTSAARPGAQVS